MTTNPTLIGTRAARTDGEAKVRGEAIYAIDYAEPSMLEARILRSPVPAGTITRLDTARAAALPGVHAIVTAADAPGRSGWVVKDARLFADQNVRYVGEPIAAVAAETWQQAEAALAAIELEIEPTDAVLTIEQALQFDAPLVHPDWQEHALIFPGPRGGNVAWESTTERGDVDAAFARDDVTVIEDEYTAPRHHQLFLEPRAATASYTGGRWTIHSAAQYVFQARNTTADYLQVAPSRIRAIVTTIGGGFGGKVDAYYEPVCAALARKARRPVRFVNTRQEEFLAGNPRENATVRIRSAVTADGEIVARDAVCLMDNGAASGELPFCAGLAVTTLAGNYRIPNVRVRTQLIYTNTAPTGAFRGMLGTYCTFAHEQHMDKIARLLGEDRRAFRIRHVIRDGDETPTGQRLDDVPFLEALDAIERIAPWQHASRPRPWHGVGLALVSWVTTPAPGGVHLKLNEDGTIGIVTGGSEIGSGALTMGIAQLVAEEFGLRPDQVIILPPDTDAAPFDAGAIGSRSVHMIGPAVQQAAQEVRAQIFETAAGLLEAGDDDLELADGHVRVVGASQRALPLATVAQAALWTTGPITGRGKHAAPPIPFATGCAVGNLMPTLNAPTFHAHLAEVEVDPESGKTTILRYVVAQDVGKAINPTGIEGQIQGGVAQGIGYALYEQLRVKDGHCLDTTLETYRVPAAPDIPPIEILLLEHPDPHGPHGAKGAGETPIIPVAAAIANAVADAIGRPVNNLPLTPFAILEAIKAAPQERDQP